VEIDMNEQPTRRSPSWKPLLLIPAAIVIAKGASRRRARWQAAGDGPRGPGRAFGHHGYGRYGFGPAGAAGDREFRLPPKIESMLEAWHTKAHEQGDTPEPTTAV
jgi:hypothetical protein